MTTKTLNTKDVCPRMAELFNAIKDTCNAECAIDAMAMVALAKIFADESPADPDSLWELSGLFADTFLDAVQRKYGQ